MVLAQREGNRGNHLPQENAVCWLDKKVSSLILGLMFGTIPLDKKSGSNKAVIIVVAYSKQPCSDKRRFLGQSYGPESWKIRYE